MASEEWRPFSSLLILGAVVACALSAIGCGKGTPDYTTPQPGGPARLEGKLINCMFYYSDALGTGGATASEGEKEALLSALLKETDVFSVVGTYTLQREKFGESTPETPKHCEVRWTLGPERKKGLVDQNGIPLSDAEDYMLRMDNPNLLITLADSRDRGNDVIHTYGRYRFPYTERGRIGENVIRIQATSEIRGFLNPLPWPPDEPELQFPIPRIIAGRGNDNLRLKDMFASGQCMLLIRNGERILMHSVGRDNKTFLEVHFDDQRRVTRMDRVSRPAFPEVEIRKRYSGDLFDLKRLIESVQFSGYSEINGAAFPCVVEIWQFGWSSRENIERAKRGEMNEVDAYIQATLATTATPKVVSHRRAEFDVSTLRVNEPLTEEDFRVHFPSGSIIELRGGSQYLIGAPGESMSDLMNRLPDTANRAMVTLLSNVKRLRIQSMHVPSDCPSIPIQYSGPVPLSEVIRPGPKLDVSKPPRNWTAAVGVLSAAGGIAALAAAIVLKRRR